MFKLIIISLFLSNVAFSMQLQCWKKSGNLRQSIYFKFDHQKQTFKMKQVVNGKGKFQFQTMTGFGIGGYNYLKINKDDSKFVVYAASRFVGRIEKTYRIKVELKKTNLPSYPLSISRVSYLSAIQFGNSKFKTLEGVEGALCKKTY